ncbi:MAG: nitronate monooxygenase [Coprothermobacterota bacterium]|nr:nitronate monooxygenase [Coprothermobacterota bacterium]
MDNRLCNLLGTRYPLIQGGMAWVSSPILAAAVSEAGALGVLAAGTLPLDLLRQQIRHTRELTAKPFGVNVMLLSPTAEAAIEVILDEKVPIVFTGGGNPAPFLPSLLGAGVIIVPVLSSVSLARLLERQGVHAVVAEGMESGGHVGEVSTLCLVPQMVDAVRLPVIAAGGIADRRGFRAALALGACGVQVGTRFLCSSECELHPAYKAKILQAMDQDTVVTGRTTGHPVRGLKNPFTRAYQKKEQSGASPQKLERFGEGRLRLAAVEGDVQNGAVMAGSISGLIREILPVRAIVAEIVGETDQPPWR